MATKIEWTRGDDGTAGETWNPVRGCSRVSEGCRFCYAEKTAYRFSGEGQPYEGLVRLTNGRPQWTGVVKLVRDKLRDPLKWKTPKRIFVNSMSDLFHESLSNEDIAEVFAVICESIHRPRENRHTYQILTKRAERLPEWFAWAKKEWPGWFDYDGMLDLGPVWLGVSVENQEQADKRIPHLLRTPVRVRWLSCEPLLGPVDLIRYLGGGYVRHNGEEMMPANVPLKDLHWIVVGGESGPGARACDVNWIRRLMRQCEASKTPVFVKQLGAKPYFGWTLAGHDHPTEREPLTLKSAKGGDVEEWPEFLRVRQFPEVTHPDVTSAPEPTLRPDQEAANAQLSRWIASLARSTQRRIFQCEDEVGQLFEIRESLAQAYEHGQEALAAPLPETERETLGRLLEEATPLPWVQVNEPEFAGVFSGSDGPLICGDTSHADAALIVATLTALPSVPRRPLGPRPAARRGAGGSGADAAGKEREMNLEACPFCGEAERMYVRAGCQVVCQKCGAEGPTVVQRNGAIAAWNRRATAPEPATPTVGAGEPRLTLGQQLRAAREAKGLSVEELAQKVSVPNSWIEVWESETHSLPGVVTSCEIAVALDLPPHTFALAHFRAQWGEDADLALADTIRAAKGAGE